MKHKGSKCCLQEFKIKNIHESWIFSKPYVAWSAVDLLHHKQNGISPVTPAMGGNPRPRKSVIQRGGNPDGNINATIGQIKEGLGAPTIHQPSTHHPATSLLLEH